MRKKNSGFCESPLGEKDENRESERDLVRMILIIEPTTRDMKGRMEK
jgi:hypothetical protein